MPSEFETVITDQTKYGTVITAQGAAIIADCILNGTKLPVVEAGAGDGGGAPTVPVPSQTALVNERWRGKIVGKERNPAIPNMIDVKIVIGDDVGDFTIREMGLFSDTGILIAVCNTPDTEKVSISGGVSGKLTMIMHIVVADASILEFVISPSLDTVSRQEMEEALDEHNAAPGAHPDIQNDIKTAQETADRVEKALTIDGKPMSEILGDIPLLKGEGAPEETTEGLIGQKYEDTSTGDIYTCIAVSAGEDGKACYVWVPGSLGTLAEIRATLHGVSTALSNKADAMPPDWYDLPLTEKFTGLARYCKDQFGRVTLSINARTIDRGRVPDGTLVATLPVGFRPMFNLAEFYYDSNKGGESWAHINVDGTLVGRGQNETNFSNFSVEATFYPAT